MAPTKKRFRIVSDDSGHEYAIPAHLREQFNAWVVSFDDFDAPEGTERVYEGPDFDEYRLNMHISNYTLTDLQEDK